MSKITPRYVLECSTDIHLFKKESGVHASVPPGLRLHNIIYLGNDTRSYHMVVFNKALHP